MPTLSGAKWVAQFPAGVSVDELIDPFRGLVRSFLTALEKAGATVTIQATYRPPQRAYLMHYAFLVATNGMDPESVPPMDGVEIDWVHRDGAAHQDVAASRQAASEMVAAYQIIYAPALESRHEERKAIDMSISWKGDLTVETVDGRIAIVKEDADLHAVGAGYGVIKLVSDPPHWSSDGH